MLIINRRQLRQILELDDLITKIDKMHLETDIVNLDKMDLAGESLTTLTTWRKNYEQALAKKIPAAQNFLEQAAEQNTHYHLFKAHKSIKQAREIMDPTYKDAKNTKEVFTELLESNRENQKNITTCSMALKKCVKTFWQIHMIMVLLWIRLKTN